MKTLRNILTILIASSCFAFAQIETEWSYTVGSKDFSASSSSSPEYRINDILVGPSGYSVIIIQRAFDGIPDETRIAMLDPKGVRIWLSDNLESVNPSSDFTPFYILSVSPGAATFMIRNQISEELKIFSFNLNATAQFSTLTVTNQKPASNEGFDALGTEPRPSSFPPNTFYTIVNSQSFDPDSLGRTVRKYKLDTVSSTVVVTESVSGTDGANFLIKWQSTVNVEYQVQESTNMSIWTAVGQPITGNGAQLSWSTPLGTGNKFYRIIQL